MPSPTDPPALASAKRAMPSPTDPPALASAKRAMAQRRARYFQKAAERDPMLIPRGKNMPAKIAASLAKGKAFRQVM